MSIRVLALLLRVLLPAFLAAVATGAAAAPLVITKAQAVASTGDRFPDALPAQQVPLPDDWAHSRPRYDGSVWYRVAFDPPADVGREDLLALYIERVCTTVEVFLNGHRIYSSARQ